MPPVRPPPCRFRLFFPRLQLPPPLATALAPSESAMLQSHHREAIENPDAMARIRAQAELLTRAGVMSNGALALAQPAPTADTSAALPGLYAAAAAAAAQDGQYERFHLPQQQWDAHRQYQHTKDFEAPYGPRSQSHPTVSTFSAAGAAGGDPQTHPPTGTTSSSFDGGAGTAAASYQHAGLPPATSLYTHQQPSHHHSRSEDLSSSEGEFGSDAGSTSTGPSHSIPSSANSSGVHLPLPGFNNLRTRDELSGKEFEQRYPGDAQTSQNNHEGFSASFGLMSLDDPAVMAGLANDGQPFFSGLTPFASGSSGSGGLFGTPTQDLIAQLKSAGGREGENKEMRDFWKMYLKTPLTSSGSGLLFPLQTPTGPGSQLGQNIGRPSPTRRHSRVASLPSMKTPPLFADERFGNSYTRPSTGDQYDSHANPPQNQGQPVAGSYNSNVRTTLHGAEDLKSYEQAVLARRAPMNLSLIPKRKGSIATTSTGGANPGTGPKSKSMSPVVPHATFPTNVSTSLPTSGASKISELLNRPGSSSSAGTNDSGGSGLSAPSETSTANTTASSSLALAFGGEQGVSAPVDGHANTSSATYLSAPSYRPSFKRIASQTLGPEHAKRALLGPAGWDHEEDEDEEEGGQEPVLEEEEEEEEQDPRMAGTAGVFAGSGVRQVSLAAAAAQS
ncbi:hypothetical protein C8Q80DRAFT_1270012 [Daedaleopsis nitida]|nr:hypothetical protein C8Q80DRAFT_1270012 [Daedaleopsis nitida]